MNIKNLFFTTLALLTLITQFHTHGMFTTKKSLRALSHKHVLQYCSQLPQKKQKHILEDSNIISYNYERDEKIITDIALTNLPKLMSDITPDNKHEMLKNIMTELRTSTGTISKIYLLNNEAVGFINYYIAQPWHRKLIPCHIGPNAYINWLAIDDKYQGQGIGSALLQHALQDCDNHSASKITLSTTDQKLENYYRKFGFACTRESKYTGVSEFTKQLQPHPTKLFYLAIRELFYKFKE